MGEPKMPTPGEPEKKDIEVEKLPEDEDFRRDWETLAVNNKELSETLDSLFEEFHRRSGTFLSRFYIQRPEQWELISDRIAKLKLISEQVAIIIKEKNKDSNIARLLDNITTSIQKYQDEFEKWKDAGHEENWNSFVSAGHAAFENVSKFNEKLDYYKTDNEWLERWGETQSQYYERVLGGDSEK